MTNEPREKGTSDFSLVLGGPLYQLYLGTRIAQPPLDLLTRRVIVITLVAWLPLVALSALGGVLVGDTVAVPFLGDFLTQIRFLVALPLLIIAELVVHRRLGVVVEQFVDRGIIPAPEMPRFRAAIDAAMRIRNSVLVEVGLLVFVYVAGHTLWQTVVAYTTPTWYATPANPGITLTPAGYWYGYVSLPIFQFILLRWYMRLLLWVWFLWRVSRLDLQLIPTHPDRAGGLGFLGISPHAFAPILFAQSAVLAALVANRIFYNDQSLLDFKLDIIALVALFVVLILAPLAVFSPRLVAAKRSGLRQYGLLATEYVRTFGSRWLPASKPARRDDLLGSADIQSLADLGNAYSVVSDMRLVPFGFRTVLALVYVTAVPFLPLLLTMFPVEEVLDRLMKIIF